jgi:hypothetical protein
MDVNNLESAVDVYCCIDTLRINIDPNVGGDLPRLFAIHDFFINRYRDKRSFTAEELQEIKRQVIGQIRRLFIDQAQKEVIELKSQKLSCSSLRVHDYVLFTALDDMWGFPAGHAASPGAKRYFLVTAKKELHPNSPVVTLECGSTKIVMYDSMFSDDNVFTIKASFPAIVQDCRLRMSFPTAKELPFNLRWRQRVNRGVDFLLRFIFMGGA